jgi:hypothetical protein
MLLSQLLLVLGEKLLLGLVGVDESGFLAVALIDVFLSGIVLDAQEA